LRRAVSKGKNQCAFNHTLATLYAEVGRCKDALDLLRKGLKMSQAIGPGSGEWLILGRRAEHYGLPEESATYYRRVEKPEHDDRLGISEWDPAQRRLAGLEARR